LPWGPWDPVRYPPTPNFYSRSSFDPLFCKNGFPLCLLKLLIFGCSTVFLFISAYLISSELFHHLCPFFFRHFPLFSLSVSFRRPFSPYLQIPRRSVSASPRDRANDRFGEKSRSLWEDVNWRFVRSRDGVWVGKDQLCKIKAAFLFL